MGSLAPRIDTPLVVDLDGVLIKTDLLFESANQFVTHHPFQCFRLLGWLLSGKAALKARLAEAVTIDPETLPYNQHVVTWLQQQKAKGRRLILATASHRTLAEQVAAKLDLFDEVLATDANTNLKAQNKRDELIRRFGERGFDYIGNDNPDIPVWQAARQAYVVSASSSLITKVRESGNLSQVFDTDRPPLAMSVIKALRLHQWVKNLLIFVPLFAAHQYGSEMSVLHALIAFFVFGLTASSVYLLNDLIDVSHDRHHHRKRNRPFAAGNLSLLSGWLLAPVLLTVAFMIALTLLPLTFVGVLATYFVMTLAYSLTFKQRPIFDVLTLAGLYTLRIIAGGAATNIPLSFWLLTFSMFFFLSLAFIKRFSELKTARMNGEVGKVAGRGYLNEDLEIAPSFGTASGYLAVLVLAFYIQDTHTSELYHTPKIIWLACPLMLYWISRAWMIAHRGQMHDDPIVFALKDKVSWLVGLCFVIVFGLARFGV